jgi:hypothetical protein
MERPGNGSTHRIGHHRNGDTDQYQRNDSCQDEKTPHLQIPRDIPYDLVVS